LKCGTSVVAERPETRQDLFLRFFRSSVGRSLAILIVCYLAVRSISRVSCDSGRWNALSSTRWQIGPSRTGIFRKSRPTVGLIELECGNAYRLRNSAERLDTAKRLQPITIPSSRYGVGRGCGVGRGLGNGVGLGVAVGVGVGVTVGVAVAEGVGVTVGVGVGVGWGCN
jgi:hypothetical protein